jgi:DNA-binding CsgD family transcriptional regulator
MRSLSVDAVKNFSQAVLHIHETRNAEGFSSNLLKAMRRILAVDICVVDWYGFQGMEVRTVYDPMDAVPARVNEALHHFAHQNPVYEQSRGTVGTISDFLSRAAWHRTDLHAEGFSQVGQEDGMVLDMELRKDCRLSLITSRGKRGFTSEERGMMGLLEPHVREVFRRLQLQNRLARSLDMASAGDPSDIPVSPREREVLKWLAEGKSNTEIAFLLGISPGTVKKHLENIYNKLGVENRHAAALLAVRSGL